MATMETEHAEALAALDKIDTASVEALTEIKREHGGVKQLLDKANERKDKVAAAVYAKVTEDYAARMRALEDKARPLREQARAELKQLLVLHAKLKSAWEASQLAQQEIEFRFELGELSKEDFEGKQKKAQAEVAEREQSFARANALRQRFEEVVPASAEPPPPPPPPTLPAPSSSSAPTGVPLARRTAASSAAASALPPPVPGSAPVPPPSPPPKAPVEARLETMVMPRDAAMQDVQQPRTDAMRTLAESLPRLVGEAGGKVYEIAAGTSIGRTSDNRIALDVREVSRHHARIDLHEDGSFVLVDMESGNGTYVNEQRVKQHKLRNGDRVRFGNEVFVYYAG